MGQKWLGHAGHAIAMNEWNPGNECEGVNDIGKLYICNEYIGTLC